MKHLKNRKYTILTVLIVLLSIWSAYGIYRFVTTYSFRSPIILQSPIYIKPVKVVSPLQKAKPKPSQKPTTYVPTAYAEALVVPQDSPVRVGSQELKSEVLSYFPKNQQQAMDNIIQKESSWRPTAINGNAGGLGQALPYSKMGCDTLEDIKCQSAWLVAYVQDRYSGDANEAWAFWQAHGWW